RRGRGADRQRHDRHRARRAPRAGGDDAALRALRLIRSRAAQEAAGVRALHGADVRPRHRRRQHRRRVLRRAGRRRLFSRGGSVALPAVREHMVIDGAGILFLAIVCLGALCLAAGVCEELVYRGTTAVLLTRLTGNLLAAIVIASAVFALAHVIQGRRAAIVVFCIALGAHALVFLTKSLFPVMAVHALYDAVGGVLMSRWYRRELESAPQPQVLSQTTPIR